MCRTSVAGSHDPSVLDDESDDAGNGVLGLRVAGWPDVALRSARQRPARPPSALCLPGPRRPLRRPRSCAAARSSLDTLLVRCHDQDHEQAEDRRARQLPERQGADRGQRHCRDQPCHAIGGMEDPGRRPPPPLSRVIFTRFSGLACRETAGARQSERISQCPDRIRLNFAAVPRSSRVRPDCSRRCGVTGDCRVLSVPVAASGPGRPWPEARHDGAGERRARGGPGQDPRSGGRSEDSA